MTTPRHNSSRLLGLGLVVLGVATLLFLGGLWLAIDRPAAPAESQPPAAASGGEAVLPATSLSLTAPVIYNNDALRPSATISMRLPMVYQNYNLPTAIFGVQMNEIAANHGLTRVVAAHSNWVRAGGVDWAAVEPNLADYHWNALAPNEAQWKRASDNGLEVLLVVGHAPAWAQKYPGVACGPINQASLVAFGNFMYALVARYSQPPYNLKYFEIWNEPDVDRNLVPPDSTFGCWGEPADDYYGGGYYGQMLQAVYPRIKAANPAAQVLVGGLLLDCDPNNPPLGKDCKPSRFFEGILRQVGGAYFDGVGVHAYDYYGGALGVYSNSNWHSASTNTNGPTTALGAKVDFVRGLMTAYSVNGKFVVNNESAVGSLAQNSNNTYETTKAYYVAEVYGAAAAKHLLANLWFSLDDDWQHQALLNANGTPRPAYYAYQFAAQQLAVASYVQPLTGYAGVKGYVFDSHGHALWLMWSQTGANLPLVLPGTPASIRGVDGANKTVTGDVLLLGPEPYYVEWAP